ncbi:hypothetical protein appser6_2470 [Actinobacillus pleuropneumoniae serovar 6 str. Femo]|uniref:Uncharacterized protein n=1 Tax=Actinobacillus pleuropneumoniae serovar 6 str. Femo TaxID=754256 RepID=A0A828PMU4_ACTPL|nr:hypothetical protein appser6_2470 [Actinobacillus pleuropneumoniae serovar 6 str. Femo]EFM97298.1 hypothetical protein appser10_2260 [Actinobacillus pleuropneumoniae serovar 10 str. D13039]
MTNSICGKKRPLMLNCFVFLATASGLFYEKFCKCFFDYV